jgi:uncharacterized protein GlcG (DUF336 family)
LAVQRPRFVEALAVASDGRFIPVLGGVLIRDSNGEIIGAIGVTGDNAENDEVAAVAGVEAAGLTPDLS